ncbi:hypothetical protein [Brachyspira hampsonii]|uniref:Uncharacterized protein n=1 Tax=Brachyspira hampsonii 30446 TaxID=1289135 RepID=A0A2U4F1P9_9SPIR|nr:hypothetical protein [Brachyspira hampsonii]EKV56187.1 hypothetical protein A966_12541 [Brachyspira hampsonii 30446]MBW5389068.1 hypothetical protein [Brachyspira hampsonii]MBW5395226.1 hypothetical protein [Brachyspira hampsonii]OEJ20282.1 hypothetical protein A9495_01605 [Brachyspira hampsonii]
MLQQKINPNDEVVVIKILAEYSDLNKYIYLVFFIDKYNSSLIDIAFVISGDRKLLTFLNAYTDLLELYKHIKIYNRLNNESNPYFDKFYEVISNILSEDRNINNIIIYQGNNNIISIIDIFASAMNKFMDFHIGTFDINSSILDINSVRTAIENVDKEMEDVASMHSANQNSGDETKDENAASEEVQTPHYKLINASFVVDPIGGKSINDIVPGDKVIVSINSNTVEENIIYLELKGKKDKYSKYLVPAEVLEKTVEEKSIKILLKLIDGYCCLIEEIEPIKLKLFNPEKDVYTEPSEEDNGNKSLFERIFSKISTFKLMMFGLGAIIIFVFIAMVYVFFFQT